MKMHKIKAIKAEINAVGNQLIKDFQDYQEGELLDSVTGLNQERTEDLGLVFKPKSSPNFKLNDDGLLILGDEHFTFSKYELQFHTFSHIEREEKGYILTTLDGSRHVISNKTYKKLMGKSKTK